MQGLDLGATWKSLCSAPQAVLLPHLHYLHNPAGWAEGRQVPHFRPGVSSSNLGAQFIPEMCWSHGDPAQNLTATSWLDEVSIKQGVSNILDIPDPRFCHCALRDTLTLSRDKSWHPVACFMCVVEQKSHCLTLPYHPFQRKEQSQHNFFCLVS